MNSRPWDDTASVRNAPSHKLNPEPTKTFFPASLFRALEHPGVVRGDPRRAENLAARRLLFYLDFTTALESLVVNPVLVSLGTGRLSVGISNTERRIAWEIYVDEAYHALTAATLADQVAGLARIDREITVSHRFREVVREKVDSVDVDPELVRLCSAVVSETLISGTLEQLPREDGVHSAIRDSVRDHERDERRHHAYFTTIFPGIWGRLHRKEQEALAPIMADFVRAFLEPDLTNLRAMTRAALEDDALANEAVDLLVSDSGLDARVRHSSRATLKLFRRAGVLDVPQAHERFEQLSLL